MAKLERLLSAADPAQHQVVITESIFSMDGDACDLPAIAALRQRFGFALLLDEAHASGVYGPRGAGYAAHLGLADHVDISLITLSKSIGVSGGALCGSKPLCDAVLNWGRACIYSTSLPPPLPAAISQAITVIADEPHRQQRLRDNARTLRTLLRQQSISVTEGDSPIIPILLGSEAAATQAGERLFQRGYLVAAVRPPTVPRGTSRLRVTVSSEHTGTELRGLVDAIAAIALD
jgi:8-amino-7-oxononanoate synthase